MKGEAYGCYDERNGAGIIILPTEYEHQTCAARSSEMGMLIYLVKTDGEKTAKGIADFFKVTKAMATNMSSALLKNGFLEKQQQENDKRSFLLLPTAKAVQLVNETYEEYMKEMHILKKNMGGDAFNSLIALLELANDILLEEKSNG